MYQFKDCIVEDYDDKENGYYIKRLRFKTYEGFRDFMDEYDKRMLVYQCKNKVVILDDFEASGAVQYFGRDLDERVVYLDQFRWDLFAKEDELDPELMEKSLDELEDYHQEIIDEEIEEAEREAKKWGRG
jgi:hypothetical protein